MSTRVNLEASKVFVRNATMGAAPTALIGIAAVYANVPSLVSLVRATYEKRAVIGGGLEKVMNQIKIDRDMVLKKVTGGVLAHAAIKTIFMRVDRAIDEIKADRDIVIKSIAAGTLTTAVLTTLSATIPINSIIAGVALSGISAGVCAVREELPRIKQESKRRAIGAYVRKQIGKV